MATILGTIVAIAVLLVSQRSYPGVQVLLDAPKSLVNHNSVVDSPLRVFLGTEEVSSPHFIQAQVVCSGTAPITPTDVERPITFTFEDAAVLHASVKETIPFNVDASVEVSDNTLVIRHGLLNPGDRILVGILVDGITGIPVVGARIAGVERLRVTELEADLARYSPFVISLPRPLEWALLLSSIFAMALVIGVWTATVYKIFRPDFRRAAKLAVEFTSVEDAVRLATSEVLGKPTHFLQKTFKALGAEDIDDPSKFSEHVKEYASSEDLKIIGDIDDFSRKVCEVAKMYLPITFAQRLEADTRTASKVEFALAIKDVSQDLEVMSAKTFTNYVAMNLSRSFLNSGLARPSRSEAIPTIVGFLVIVLPFLATSVLLAHAVHRLYTSV